MMDRKGLLLVIALALCTAAPVLAQQDEALVRYDDYKLVRVKVDSWSQIDALHQFGARLMSEAEGLGAVDYLVPPEAMAGLAALGLPTIVLNDNVQRDIDAERQRLALQGPVDPRDRGWFDDYKNIDAVNAKLNAMATDRPDLASVFDIGVTLQNRHIYGIRISGPGTNKPAVQFNGCHHAREWISVMVPMWIADKLVYTYDTDPDIHTLVDSLEFFIIPVVNVDGYVYSWTTDRNWRKNRRLNAGGCYGVDDNRNYSIGWGGGGSSSNPCDETYRGTAAFSEPETAAMRDFAVAHPNIITCHSYHSYSQLVMSPWGYTNTLPPDNDIFMEMDAAMAAAIYAVHGQSYGYGPIYSTIYQASGGDTDWYYGAEGIFSFTTELRDTGYYGFELPPDQIIPTCEENFPAAVYQSNWATSPVKFAFPFGLPTRLDPNTPTLVKLKISAVGATLDPNTLKMFTRIGTYAPYVEQSLTSLGNNVYQGTLPGTRCGKTCYYYFSAATTTGVVGTSPSGAPASAYSVVAAPIQLVLDQPLNSNPGWTISGGTWAFGHPTGGSGSHGGPDPNNGHSGTNVYGYNLSGGYTNSMPERHLTTTAINCTGVTGVRLSFWRWLGVEAGTYDHAYIRIATNVNGPWTTIWQNPDSTLDDSAWVYQELDISPYANNMPQVFLRWTMGTSDSYMNYCGWNIDDVQIWAPVTTCPLTPGDLNCDGLVDFDDINPFVTAISDPVAYETAFPNCDLMNADCDNSGAVNFDDINPFVALLSQ